LSCELSFGSTRTGCEARLAVSTAETRRTCGPFGGTGSPALTSRSALRCAEQGDEVEVRFAGPELHCPGSGTLMCDRPAVCSSSEPLSLRGRRHRPVFAFGRTQGPDASALGLSEGRASALHACDACIVGLTVVLLSGGPRAARVFGRAEGKWPPACWRPSSGLATDCEVDQGGAGDGKPSGGTWKALSAAMCLRMRGGGSPKPKRRCLRVAAPGAHMLCEWNIKRATAAVTRYGYRQGFFEGYEPQRGECDW
jgi:hypothetical protein